MDRSKDLITKGDQYSLLTVVKEVERKNAPGRQVFCQCECGKKKIVSFRDLKRGNVKSCGCLKNYSTENNENFHNMSNTRLYAIWSDMKHRCLNENNIRYKRYGGRGISVCEEWLEFKNFYEWAKSSGYKDELTLDRVDNNKGYSPRNCKWSTQKEQAWNRSTTFKVERNGVSKSLREWCRLENVPFNMVYRRLRRGWDIEDALRIPPIPKGQKYVN